ncbi:MAG: hypothetical protein ACRDHL_10425 [Candidatus Promineifilaceae bacterium]
MTGLALRLGLTAALAGYFMVWFPQPAVGLSLVGLELGEWSKFVPAVAAGQITPGRTLFYAPPLALGMALALWALPWRPARWQGWLARALGAAMALLAAPSLESILEEPAVVWLPRLGLVGLVAAAALVTAWLPAGLRAAGLRWRWPLLAGLAAAGALLPSWAYLAMRPAIGELMGQPVGFGPGFWLNGLGFGLVGLVAIRQARAMWALNSQAGRRAAGAAPAGPAPDHYEGR